MDIKEEQPAVVGQKVIVHFVRHAQSFHNIHLLSPEERVHLDNPRITNHGKEQCKILSETFPNMSNINIILCSPLNRTLETALHAFQPLLARGLRVFPWPDLIEWGAVPCNHFGGSWSVSLSQPELPKDFSLMLVDYEDPFAEDRRRDRKSRLLRVKKALFSLGQALKTKDGLWKDVPVGKLLGGESGNVEILVITHGGFLRSLLGHSRQFRNTEFRSYEFASDEMVEDGAMPYDFQETEDSRCRIHYPLVEKRSERLVFSHSSLTPEEMMARLPKYAWNPEDGGNDIERRNSGQYSLDKR